MSASLRGCGPVRGIATALLLALAATAAAQSSTATISGTIRDETGVLPGASVSAKDAQSGFTTETVSGGDGSFALPGLRPVTMFVTLTTIIASANMFGQAFIMTNGAPARETRTAIFYIAETGLQDFQMGEAAAASWILTVALMFLSLVVFGVFRARGSVES